MAAMKLEPVKFVPICPSCGTIMILIKGQKTGAWRCPNRKCKAEFWDDLDRNIKLDDLLNLPQDNAIKCPRCIIISMVLFSTDSWCCPQCMSQLYKEGAPEFHKILDQMIKTKTKHLAYDNMRTKHKSSGSRSGKRHKAPPKIDWTKRYYFSDRPAK